MTDVLNVSLRNVTGTGAARRLRREGLVPAILYGHGEENVNLSIPMGELEAVVRHGAKLVDLNGGVSEKALIRAIQWDSFGTRVLHLDLNRVSVGERVTLTVPLELRGEAPGSKHGGILEHHVYDVEIECPAGEIPEKLLVSIKNLEVGGSILMSEVPVPPSVKVLTPPETMVVHCQAAVPTAEEEALGEAPSAVEPEVIGRKADASEENSD